MASLVLIDYTQDLQSWHLPQQQHGVRQPPRKRLCEEAEPDEEAIPEPSAE